MVFSGFFLGFWVIFECFGGIFWDFSRVLGDF